MDYIEHGVMHVRIVSMLQKPNCDAQTIQELTAKLNNMRSLEGRVRALERHAQQQDNMSALTGVTQW